ncbi:MAG: SHOCT domain-containing protein [Actinobacteria bacterium]|nr:SHOCT domain-containing protein [Actinomycetota bacterium]
MSLLTALIPTADWHGPGWWVVLIPIGWFLFFFLIFFAFRRLGWWGCGWGAGYGPHHGRRGWGGPVDALEVLDRRFAEGEIDAEEYGSRRAALEKGRAGSR